MAKILVVDATPALVTLLQSTQDSGSKILLADSPAKALELARSLRPEVAVVDVEIGSGSGLALAADLKAAVPAMEILVVTEHASLDSAIAAFKVGAFDYLSRPIDPADLKLRIANAVEKVRLQRERIRVEEENALLASHLREAAKLDSMGRLAGGVAHDFNNLLTVIAGSAEILLGAMPLEDPLRAQAEAILDSADRATKLTRQLMAFGRPKPARFGALEVNKVVTEMRNLLSHLLGSNIELVTRLATDLWTTRADSDQLGQVIFNMAANSRDAMPKGGKLVIETANKVLDDRAAAVESGLRPGRYVVLTVSDNGSGMTRETLSRLFEPFFTTKQPGVGTGLGLAAAYGIVKQAGGAIRPYSEHGLGATFRIYLPAIEGTTPTMTAPTPPSLSRAPQGEGETILIADDEEGIRRLLARILLNHGYAVLEAKDGAEAMAEAERHQGKIELLLTDLAMPNMTGAELAKALTKVRPQVEVLYMSAYPAEQFGLVSATEHFLAKPFSEQDLLRAVAERLGGRTSDATTPKSP